jgi:hypothetical protein
MSNAHSTATLVGCVHWLANKALVLVLVRSTVRSFVNRTDTRGVRGMYRAEETRSIHASMAVITICTV